jgi:hypothetical protein
MTQFHLWVPIPGSRAEHRIDRGSALVSDPDAVAEDGRVLVYYEGNRYGAINLRRYVERAVCAAGRMRERYPTVAMGALPEEELMRVGVLDYTKRVVRIDDGLKPLVEKWINGSLVIRECVYDLY